MGCNGGLFWGVMGVFVASESGGRDWVGGSLVGVVDGV